MIKIIEPTSEDQLKRCVDIYIAQHDDFFPVDRNICYRNVMAYWRMPTEYVKIIEHNRTIVGFIAGAITTSKHSREKYLLQEYYVTNLKGFSAAKAVFLAHRDFEKFARDQRISMVISQGSHMDPDHTFTRLLEKDGWSRRGHIAIKRFDK